MRAFALLVAAAALFGQDQKPSVTARGSISGVVKVQGAGTPIPDVQVFAVLDRSQKAKAKTDAEGRYALRLLEPGSYTIYAMAPAPDGVRFGSEASRTVTLQAEQELTNIDVRIALPGRISGKVMDENGEPVAGIAVMLVAREYVAGALRHVFANTASTDDQGRYNLTRVKPGRGYLLLATKYERRLPAIADAPDDPELRRPVPAPTYYPDSRTVEGAETLTLRAAEHRENIDIRLRKAASYCMEAVLSGPTGAENLSFNIAPERPKSGQSGDGGFYMATPGGKPGPDGKIRVCELPPGDYELEASQFPSDGGFNGPDFLGVAAVTISDRDVSGVRVTALPKVPVAGEMVWDGAPPDKPWEKDITLDLRSVSRTLYPPSAKSPLPGQFGFDGLVMDEYTMAFRGLSGGLYLKDVTYGGHSVLRKSLRPGTTADSTLRVTVGRDGGFVAVKAVDKSGNPADLANTIVFPAAVNSEADMAASLTSGSTDQNGAWTSGALAPGKYYTLASEAAVDKSPESIGKVWRARSRAQEVEVQPGATARVSLEVRGLE